jgi:hypothetical protein
MRLGEGVAVKNKASGSERHAIVSKERMNHSVAKSSLDFQSRDDVQRFWLRVRDVPRRTEGRSHKQYERFYLGLYLLALADHGLLSYSLKIKEGDSPDFMLEWKSGETTGLEVTRATDEELQRAITRAEKEHSEGSVIMPSPFGYAGDQLEEESCRLFRKAIEKKIALLPKYRPASRYDLLVSDDTRMGAGDRRKVLAILIPWVRAVKQGEPKLGKISVVASLDVLYDIGEESRIFPYIEWSAPKAHDAADGEAFSERIEHAGRIAAEEAIHAHKTAGTPICFIDSKGRLVKETSDGRRLEVRVNENGEEVTIQELFQR